MGGAGACLHAAGARVRYGDVAVLCCMHVPPPPFMGGCMVGRTVVLLNGQQPVAQPAKPVPQPAKPVAQPAKPVARLRASCVASLRARRVLS
eukprot:118623-Chlamydomonas_euryale.AAC.1